MCMENTHLLGAQQRKMEFVVWRCSSLKESECRSIILLIYTPNLFKCLIHLLYLIIQKHGRKAGGEIES